MFKTMTALSSIAVLPLSACMINDPLVGTGPIELSRGVQRGFDQYQGERTPGHFAVSLDGRVFSYDYCPEGRCRQASKSRSIYNCEQRSGGVPCKIYGALGEVVWRAEDDSAS